MLNTKNNVAARMSYDNVRKTLFDAWIKDFGNVDQCNRYVESMKLSEGTVRLENLLSAANNSYDFAVTPQQQNTSGTAFRTELRLNQSDTFIITSMGFFIGKPADADPTNANYKLKTYADPFSYGADADLINNIIFSNSKIKLTVNNDVLIPGSDVFRHLYIPQTQQTAAAGAGSPLDQIEGAENGFITAEPNLWLIGPKNSIPQLILPTALTGLASTTTRLVLMFRGIVAQNSTVTA